MYKRAESRTATIASGAAVSDEAIINDYFVTGIHMPADWTAANLTFQAASEPGGTFYDVYDSDGTELAVTAAEDRSIGLTSAESAVLSGFRVIKVRSGTSASPVNQAAARSVVLILK